MNGESYKAENSNQIIWLRINRLKSVKLCENLIRRKLEKTPNLLITDDVLKNKAIGLASAIESAIGYWEAEPRSLNARVLSRYYFLLQMTIAEQVCRTTNLNGLKEVQKYTEYGHGLGTIIDSESPFPDNYYVFPIQNGHFYSYSKEINKNIKDFSFDKKPRKFSEVAEREKLVSLTDVFRRIPELNNIIEEYLGKPPLAFHIGYSHNHNLHDYQAAADHGFKTGEFTLVAPPTSSEKLSYIEFYCDSKKITPEYLTNLNLPFTEFTNYNNVSEEYSCIVGKLIHPSDKHWHQYIKTYSSPYSPTTYALPLWTKEYDSIITNLTTLYALSIIVRYLPDLWYRITTGDLNHIGSLIEYYITVMDNIIPIQMLERITESKISIHNPGSFFGPI